MIKSYIIGEKEKKSTALDPSAKPYIFEAAKKSKEDALERRGLKANLEMVDIMYQYRVNYISQTKSSCKRDNTIKRQL